LAAASSNGALGFGFFEKRLNQFLNLYPPDKKQCSHYTWAPEDRQQKNDLVRRQGQEYLWSGHNWVAGSCPQVHAASHAGHIGKPRLLEQVARLPGAVA
jgi:hypothetical protein